MKKGLLIFAGAAAANVPPLTRRLTIYNRLRSPSELVQNQSMFSTTSFSETLPRQVPTLPC